jgi:hypothetical protein
MDRSIRLPRCSPTEVSGCLVLLLRYIYRHSAPAIVKITPAILAFMVPLCASTKSIEVLVVTLAAIAARGFTRGDDRDAAAKQIIHNCGQPIVIVALPAVFDRHIAAFHVLLNPNWPAAAGQLSDVEEAARAIGVQTHVFRASTDGEIDTAFVSVVQHRILALAVASDPFFTSRRDKLAALAARHAVPAMYPFRDYAVAGGLMSYGIDLPSRWHARSRSKSAR